MNLALTSISSVSGAERQLSDWVLFSETRHYRAESTAAHLERIISCWPHSESSASCDLDRHRSTRPLVSDRTRRARDLLRLPLFGTVAVLMQLRRRWWIRAAAPDLTVDSCRGYVLLWIPRLRLRFLMWSCFFFPLCFLLFTVMWDNRIISTSQHFSLFHGNSGRVWEDVYFSVMISLILSSLPPVRYLTYNIAYGESKTSSCFYLFIYSYIFPQPWLKASGIWG